MKQLLTLFSLITFSSALAQSAIDPLQRPTESVGTGQFSVSLGYTPFGNQTLAVDSSGQTQLVVQQGNAFGLSLSGGYALTSQLSFSGSVTAGAILLREIQGALERNSSALDGSASLALSYRLEPKSEFDPRLGVFTAYPWNVGADISASLVRDPIVLSASLGLFKALEADGFNLTLGSGVGFIANERIRLDAGFGQNVPLGGLGVPSTSVSLRVGYTLDPESKREVGVRTAFSSSSGESRLGLGLEFSVRARTNWKPQHRGM